MAEARRWSGQIPALDGVRGVAIILVLLIHFGQGWPVISRIDWVPRLAFGVGWCGVDLFFVLSGFLITGILLETRDASNYFTAFYARRALRIFPLYYAFLFVWFVVLPAAVNSTGHELAIDVGADRQGWFWTYLSNALPLDRGVPALQHMWSLAVEEQFYLVWPTVVALFPGRRLGRACLVLIAGALMLRTGLTLSGASWFISYAAMPARVDALAMGALLAVSVRDDAWRRLLERGWMFAATFGAAVTLATFVGARGPWQWHPLVQTLGYSGLAVMFAGLLAGVVLRGARVLEVGPLRAFGKYSYAIYLLHIPCLFALNALLPASVLQTRVGYTLALMVPGVAISFVGALGTWHLFERRLLALKRWFEPRRSAGAERGATRSTSA